MKPITSQELQRLEALQSAVMDDLCHIRRVTLSSGTYGNTVESRVFVVSGQPCGIEFTNGKVTQRGETQFVDYDAILRIRDGIFVLMTDEIELIEKGEFQISGTFKPASAPIVNSSVQKIQIKRQAP